MTFICYHFGPLTALRTEGHSPENALREMERVLEQDGNQHTLTYRSTDGAVFHNTSHFPSGCVYIKLAP